MALTIKSSTGYPNVSQHLRPAEIDKGTPVGIDLEFPNGTPSIIGVGHWEGKYWCAHSVPWNESNEAKLRDILSYASEIVGHNIVGADIPLLFKHLVFPM